MARLNNLASFQSKWDVVALTGDCVSQTSKQVPPGWDAWPQKLKVSVPGNHDHPDTFDLLRTWRHQAPWVCRLDDLVFVGLDSPLPDRVEKNLRGVDLEGARGIVLLFHERPRIEEDRLADVLRGFVGSREMLILHGHEHPASFKGAEWDQSGRLGGKSYFRSKVCSSVSSRRGLGHLIWWDKHSFRCEVVQGPETPLMWLNPKAVHTTWGKGSVVKREGQGQSAKLTVNFPGCGEKKLIANHPELKLEE